MGGRVCQAADAKSSVCTFNADGMKQEQRRIERAKTGRKEKREGERGRQKRRRGKGEIPATYFVLRDRI